MGSRTLNAMKNAKPPPRRGAGEDVMNIASRMLCALLLSALATAQAAAEVKLPVPAVDQTAVAKRGYFYVGGQYTGEPGKNIMQGQIYVEVLAPKRQARPYPLV